MKAKDLYNALIIGSGGGVTPTGTIDITQNGTVDVTQYASADVDVPNTYGQDDEGKVVSSGALVSQTSRNITENGTVDTTLNNEVVVSVQPNLTTKNITQNGTYTASSDNADGYSSVTVNTPAPPMEPGEVNFFDYDGTLLYVMTIAEARALQALPALPDHSQDEIPLTNAQWNFTLEELHNLQIPMDIGATYSVSFFTYLIVDLPPDELTVRIRAYGSFSVWWGDGTQDSAPSSYSTNSLYHTYQTSGRKIIKIYATRFDSSVNSLIAVLKTTSSTNVDSNIKGDRYAIKALYYPSQDYTYGFGGYYDLDYVVISNELTSMKINDLSNCNIKYMAIPRSMTAYASNPTYLGRISCPGNLIRYNASRLPSERLCIYTVANADVVFNIYDSSSTLLNVTKELYIQTANRILFNCSINYLRKLKVVGDFGIDTSIKCISLEEVDIPSLSGAVPNNGFLNCLLLKEIKLPEGVTSIGNMCFDGCSVLQVVDLPSTITSIGNNIFNYSTQRLVCRATTPPTLGTAFNSNYPEIYVPDAAVEDYKAATNWATSSARIHPLSDIEPTS